MYFKYNSNPRQFLVTRNHSALYRQQQFSCCQDVHRYYSLLFQLWNDTYIFPNLLLNHHTHNIFDKIAQSSWGLKSSQTKIFNAKQKCTRRTLQTATKFYYAKHQPYDRHYKKINDLNESYFCAVGNGYRFARCCESQQPQLFICVGSVLISSTIGQMTDRAVSFKYELRSCISRKVIKNWILKCTPN
ncbi:Hypothetical_protein [Hexamita inflata]|uniref:Hypothetical_protein n=1 Tax=Hexamita inflata TaxID=28002 RepID=A0AA86N4E4_9EUKA|nr:Hypothetical protein HINF_LOCUS171 [Hexamita inflata]